jgi:alginate O-acetyltransferase complex protein AlgI
MITMTLGGLWHGAAILFILWGVWHGVMLVLFKPVPVHRFLTRRLGVIGKWLSILLTCHIVCVGWSLFRAHTATIMPLLQSIPALFQPGNLILLHAFARGVIILGAVTLLTDYLGYRKDGEFSDLFKTMNPYIGIALIAACYCGLMILGKRESTQFIYFQF